MRLLITGHGVTVFPFICFAVRTVGEEIMLENLLFFNCYYHLILDVFLTADSQPCLAVICQLSKYALVNDSPECVLFCQGVLHPLSREACQ